MGHNGQGYEGYEGSGTEGDEDEGCHESDEEEGCHEGHEGHEGDEEEGCHEGHEGDEGHEEEVREQDCEGRHGKGHGAAWQQGEDRWRLDFQGLVQEQERQGCEQEAERERQEVPMDPGLPEGSQGLEDYWLHCDQEGHTPVCEGEGVLRQLSALLSA